MRLKNKIPYISTLILLLISLLMPSSALAFEAQNLPTKENPLTINEKEKKVMIYTEVHGKNVHQYNTHWGVVFKDGKLQDKAILKSYVSPKDFYDALIKIGAKAGDNLNKDTNNRFVEGDMLDIRATWQDLGKELALSEIFEDTEGKGFLIKFGGNRKSSEEHKTGCITCLESCWIAITSNAKYPQISDFKRLVSPNSKFRGKANILPSDGRPVILIYRLIR